MKNVLEKLQALGKSKLTRLGAELLIAVATFWILIFPHLRRPEVFLLNGKEAYYHLQNGAVSVILSFLNNQTGVDKILIAKIMPILLGITSILLFYDILRKLDFDYEVVIISTLILIISPSFIYLFGTLNAYSFTSVLFLVAFYFFLIRKEVIGIIPFYIIPFFGTAPTIIGLLLLLIYSLKNRKIMLFLGALPSIALLYFSQTKILSGYGSSFISDFGGYYGLGLFIILLSLFGLKYLWQKKYKHIVVYIAILSLCALSFLDIRIISYLNFILANLAALGLVNLIRSEWRSNLIKQLSILIMVYGLIFSGLSYINFISKDLPNKDVIDMIEHLKTLPDERVFSQASRQPWIEYSGKRFVTDENLFYTKDVEQALTVIEAKKIRYLWIDNEMKEKIWSEEEQGLQFLLEYSKYFKKNKINNYVTLWEFDEDAVSN